MRTQPIAPWFVKAHNVRGLIAKRWEAWVAVYKSGEALGPVFVPSIVHVSVRVGTVECYALHLYLEGRGQMQICQKLHHSKL